MPVGLILGGALILLRESCVGCGIAGRRILGFEPPFRSALGPERTIAPTPALARFTRTKDNHCVVRITDFQHAVGRNGEVVPVPPEWNFSLGGTVRIILGAAAVLACFILLLPLVSIFSQLGQTPPLILAQRLLFVVALAAAGGLVAIGLGLLIAMCWWPWSRRSLGVHLEDEVQKLSLEELNERIARCEAGWLGASSSKRKDGYLRRLVWLEGQAMRLHGVPAPRR